MVFSSTEGDLIEIPVIVTDKKGRFIEGLNKYDFEIFEDRKKQDIEDFYLQKTVDGRSIIRYENGDIEERIREFLIIFDQSSTNPFSLQRIKDPLKNFLSEYFNSGDNIYFVLDRYIIAWQGRKLLHLGQEAVQIRNREVKNRIVSEMISNLADEVIDITLSPEKSSEIPLTPDKGFHPKQKPKDQLSYLEMSYREFAAFNFIDRLKALAHVAEKIKGEKVALLISANPQLPEPTSFKSENRTPKIYLGGGFFKGVRVDKGQSFAPTFTFPSSLGNQFSHSKTCIHSVLMQSQQLSVPQMDSTEIIKNVYWEREAEDPLSNQDFVMRDLHSATSSYQDAIKTLSKDTGGITFTQKKSFEDVLNQIGQAMQKSYVLSYSSNNEKMDGRFRKIEVRIRRKDVKVRHRKGYYAIDKVQEELKELKKSLEKKISSEYLTTFIKKKTIPLEINRYYLLIKIEPKGLILNNVIEEKEGVFFRNLFNQIQLFFQLEDKRGKVISRINKKFDFEIDEKSLTNRPAIYFGQELEKGHYKIKIALKDKIGGEIVTQEKIVEVGDGESMSEAGKGANNFFFVKRDSLNRE